MNKTTLFAALILLPLAAAAQTTTTTPTPASTTLTTVSISANGVDVKNVLHEIFTTAKKSYVIQPYTYFSVNLALDNVDFDEALQIICKTADLHYEIQNGIYFISKGPALTHRAAQKIVTAPTEVVKPAKTGKLAESVFGRKLTTRLTRTSLADVFLAFATQTETTIEVDKAVPAYKLDAFLVNTSLRYALDRVTKAAGLAFELTDHQTIRVFKLAPADLNRVTLTQP